MSLICVLQPFQGILFIAGIDVRTRNRKWRNVLPFRLLNIVADRNFSGISAKVTGTRNSSERGALSPGEFLVSGKIEKFQPFLKSFLWLGSRIQGARQC